MFYTRENTQISQMSSNVSEMCKLSACQIFRVLGRLIQSFKKHAYLSCIIFMCINNNISFILKSLIYIYSWSTICQEQIKFDDFWDVWQMYSAVYFHSNECCIFVTCILACCSVLHFWSCLVAVITYASGIHFITISIMHDSITYFQWLCFHSTKEKDI